MEKHHFIFPLLVSIVIALGFISFSLCIAAEFKKSKKKDVRLDGKYCYVPGSSSFGLGIAALTCLFIAQFIGNLLMLFSRDHGNSCKTEKKSILPALLLAFSWISFGMGVVLIGAGTSLSTSQNFGEGWIDGECYIVKDGVYTASAILVMLTLSLTLASAIIKVRKRNQIEQDTRGQHPHE